MLTEAEIKKQLLKNPDWEPDIEATDEEWDLFESVSEKLLKENLDKSDTKSEDEEQKIDYEDDDDDWPYDDYDLE